MLTQSLAPAAVPRKQILGFKGDGRDSAGVIGVFIVLEGRIAKINIPCITFLSTASFFFNKKCCSAFESFMAVSSLSIVLVVPLISL